MYLTNNSLDLYAELQNYRTKHPYPESSRIESTMSWYYMDLIKTMFFELIVSDNSLLLSFLCEKQIEYRPKHFVLSVSGRIEEQSNFDLYPIVQGLAALFKNDSQACTKAYENNARHLFIGYKLKAKYTRQILECLVDIDNAIEKLKGKRIPQKAEGFEQAYSQQKEQIELQKKRLAEQEKQLEENDRQLTSQRQQLKTLDQQLEAQKRELAVRELQPSIGLEQQPAAQENQMAGQEVQPVAQSQHSKKEEMSLAQELNPVVTREVSKPEEFNPAERPSLQEKFKLFASNRQKEDADLLQKIQNLQAGLQSELQEIAKIREGLEYEALRESIMQVLAIHDLLWNILESHPMADSTAGYDNLIYSCQDLKENVVQALAMLGVTCINDPGVPYHPHMHSTPRGTQPVRNAMVTKVLKPGFSYRSQTLEKAIVELQ